MSFRLLHCVHREFKVLEEREKMADIAALRKIVRDVVIVMKAKCYSSATKMLLDAQSDRAINTLPHKALSKRLKSLLEHLTPAKLLKMYNAGVFANDYTAIKAVWMEVAGSSLANTRDGRLLKSEFKELGKDV